MVLYSSLEHACEVSVNQASPARTASHWLLRAFNELCYCSPELESRNGVSLFGHLGWWPSRGWTDTSCALWALWKQTHTRYGGHTRVCGQEAGAGESAFDIRETLSQRTKPSQPASRPSALRLLVFLCLFNWHQVVGIFILTLWAHLLCWVWNLKDVSPAALGQLPALVSSWVCGLCLPQPAPGLSSQLSFT